MHPTHSYLYTLLERIRHYVEHPDLDAKYNNDYIVRHVIMPCTTDVLSRLNNNSQSQIILSAQFQLTETDEYYQLPPCVQEVLRFVVTSADGSTVLFDIVPRDIQNRYGAGWRLEGVGGALRLVMDKGLSTAATVAIWYISNGDVFPHYAIDGTVETTLSSSGGASQDRVMLSAAPELGDVDRRENAYAGCVLRILPATPRPIEERIISRSYLEADKWYADVTTPFVHTPDGPTIYEIAPPAHQALYEAVATLAALKLGVGLRISQTHSGDLKTQYKMALKTIGDNLTFMNSRKPHSFVPDTVDNPQAQGWTWSGSPSIR